MDLFNVIILGIVEGITEFLPVSSTGHLILTSSILKIPQSEFLKTFEIAIQLGAIVSVVVLYWKSLLLDKEMIKKIIAAFVPTAVIGLILYKFVKSFLLGSKTVVIWSLLIGGIFIVVFELLYKRKPARKESGTYPDIDRREGGSFARAEARSEDDGVVTALRRGRTMQPQAEKMTSLPTSNIRIGSSVISYKQAFLIGLAQAVSIIPGVSRSAATIIGGLALGLSRKTIVEFSFLLAVPTMAAAVALDLLKTAGSFTPAQFGYLTAGFIVSFIAAMLAIKFLLSFIKNNNFIIFGIYRVILALLFLCLMSC